MRPARTGIAAYSAEVLPLLRRHFDIDVYDEQKAHDFVWTHAKRPYDLTVYQMGNSLAHAYQWAYLARYPGLTVLHDAQLHQARALHLLQQHREQDYRAELNFSHPDAPDGVADLVSAGLGGSLYYLWPMLRLVVGASRMSAVHDRTLAEHLRAQFPDAAIGTISMGVRAVSGHAGAAVRARHGIPENAVVFGCYGNVTAAKRIEPMLGALARVARQHPAVHLLIVGDTSQEFDVARAAAERGIAGNLTMAGYVDDEALDGYLQAADVCVCLRWPSTGETSASWLRCLAAGKPTIVTNLVQSGDVPRLDPRDWRQEIGSHLDPIAVAVDVLDEDRTLELAMGRLASDAELRARLGANASAYWTARHTVERMADSYVEVIRKALERPVPEKQNVPRHLEADGTALARRLAAEMSVSVDFLDT
jgi:glycosyltransferase involved in cell wall biosynthesis